MKFIDEPWKKHAIICLLIVIISLIILNYDIIAISVPFFIASILFFSLSLFFIALIFYVAFFKTIKAIYKDATELNNYSYSQYNLFRRNLYVIIVISLYLVVFYTYFAILIEDNLFKLLLAWLPVLIIRISHYADYETGSKIGKAIADYIFPIWLILLAYHIKNFGYNIFTIFFKNPDVFYFFISIIATTYFIEIIMSMRNKTIISDKKINNNNNHKKILAEYHEILYSVD